MISLAGLDSVMSAKRQIDNVESAIYSHPAVAEAIVIGVPGGQYFTAFEIRFENT